jgi:hypothetical protein
MGMVHVLGDSCCHAAWTIHGATASLTGTGFSDLAEDNVICFAGGICLTPDIATTRVSPLVR